MSVDLDAIKKEVAQQQAVAVFNAIRTKMTDTCFKKVIRKPGPRLTRGEMTRLGQCVDRYSDALKIISNTISERSKRNMAEMEKMQQNQSEDF